MCFVQVVAGLKDTRDRINSVKSTQKITDAMKLVAAAKVRRAQDAVVNGRPFAENLVKVSLRSDRCCLCLLLPRLCGAVGRPPLACVANACSGRPKLACRCSLASTSGCASRTWTRRWCRCGQ